MTAAAPTYLPNDRAFGATNEKNAKRLCNTLVFVGIRVICIYIYIYKEVFTYCFTYRGGPGLVSRSVIQSFIAFGSTRYEWPRSDRTAG